MRIEICQKVIVVQAQLITMPGYEDEPNPAELLIHIQPDIPNSLRVLFRVIELLSHLLNVFKVIYYYTVTIPGVCFS